MHILSRGGQRTRWLVTSAALLTLAAACSSDAPVGTQPELPGNPPIPPQYRGAAFLMDVSTTSKRVRITAPAGTIANPSSMLNLDVKPGDLPGISQSLLGGDVVELVPTSYVAGALGAAVPGKILITFDLTINNKLPGIELTTPTFPTPPASAVGVQLFPFEISVVTTSGGVDGTGGNEVIVNSPRFGAVVASNDWDGDPHNFFNDVGCSLSSNDCFRYEPFGVVAPQGASTTRKVGFLIDPTVGEFRVKMIVAADLRPTETPDPGTILGEVVSPQIGDIAGALVSVSGGYSGTTNASGDYTIPGVATGSRTVSVSNLPSNCTAPASQSVTVTPGGSHTVNFSVTCVVPTGTISGTVSSSLGGGLSGVQVTVTPTGGSALPAATTSSSGGYSVPNVPTIPSSGSISFANLPSNCTNPGPQPYSGMTTAGLVQDFVITCEVAPHTYPFSSSWGAITTGGPTGRQVTLTLAIDMGPAPGRPDIDGDNADPLAGIQFSVAYDGTKLDYTSRTLLSPDEFDLGTVGESNAGTLSAQANVAVSSTSGATKTGNVQLIRLTFNIAEGASGTINPTIAIVEALATTSLINVTSSVVVLTPPALVIP